MFELVKSNHAAGIYVDKGAADYAGLLHVAGKLQADIRLVTDAEPAIDDTLSDGFQIIAGTIGSNPVIDRMIEKGELDVAAISGKRESYAIRLFGDKLVVAGTETVSTLHGMYHISEKIGVSPWVYWGDAVPKKQSEIVFGDEIVFTSK